MAVGVVLLHTGGRDPLDGQALARACTHILAIWAMWTQVRKINVLALDGPDGQRMNTRARERLAI